MWQIMAILDNAIWLTAGDGTAQGGTTTIPDGVNSTDVTTTFTPNAWDGDANGTGVSEFGAFGLSSPIVGTWDFSNPVSNLNFDLQHVNSSGSYDDLFVLYFYDENGDLLPTADVINGISGLDQDLVYANPDGSVSVEAEGANANNINISLPGPISFMEIRFGPGPDGTLSGGAGLSDMSFDVIPVAVCFTKHTYIQTIFGPKPIETLKVGDLIKTRDNGYQPLRWIGAETVNARGRAAPIVIAPNTFGKHAELIVSQQHRILIGDARTQLLFGEDSVLIAAKHLTWQPGVSLHEGDGVTYYHMLFDRHEIVFANGLASESFHPGQYGLGGLNVPARQEIFSLMPQLAGKIDTFGRAAYPILRQHEAAILQSA